MTNLTCLGSLTLFFFFQSSCSQEKGHQTNLELVPWCVVTFDSLERSPLERITMLKEMGFIKYGYETRTGYPIDLKEEINLAQRNDLEITSVFLWLNSKRDSLGKLSPTNERILEIIKDSGIKPTLWLSFNHNYFEALDQEQSLTLAIEFVKFIKLKADEIGCKVALYNHHGWFGDPHNQLEIIESLAQDSLTLVYNFHHAHDYLDEFPEIAKRIKPYLSHVNVNGMNREGPQILTVGKGNFEQEMIQLLIEEGYDGPWGVLGHIDSEDVQLVLDRNIKGFNDLISGHKQNDS